ncbi:MAG: glutathione S-transferase [SAR116 cluster bacterium]|nr:glutathione S-transferase [SAR116 cluster bacterium]RPH09474.1 MAG: glutathione S-transferase family protein [Alphaproteobacteria bacterium TMED54]
MNRLYHYFLCPSSRLVRIILSEKKIDFELFIENFSDPSEEYLLKNPAGFFPVLNTSFNQNIVGALVIVEHVENLMLSPVFLKKKNENEIRRLLHWFEYNFKNEVIIPLLREKIFKRFNKNSIPSSQTIRTARSNLKYHMQYFNYIIKENDFFVDDTLSYVDLFYGSSLSVLDYIDELNFFDFEKLKNLYFIIKSRPSFKKILADRIIGVNPPSNYYKLDY